MSRKARKKKKERERVRETPEHEDAKEEHPILAEESGAWSDHDCDWILQGRMP